MTEKEKRLFEGAKMVDSLLAGVKVRFEVHHFSESEAKAIFNSAFNWLSECLDKHPDFKYMGYQFYICNITTRPGSGGDNSKGELINAIDVKETNDFVVVTTTISHTLMDKVSNDYEYIENIIRMLVTTLTDGELPSIIGDLHIITVIKSLAERYNISECDALELIKYLISKHFN